MAQVFYRPVIISVSIKVTTARRRTW